ncbi:MAG: alpha/beta hydrolase [Geoalkalibacter sp.]|uniref:alpha/beta hydrolase n=1 Tax=Geoalkalibacter sp. TaxID=3041440 RepID=UPI003D0E7448
MNGKAQATAGLRGAGWLPNLFPDDARVEIQSLTTADKAKVTGALYSRGNEKKVAFFMHPREFSLAFYAIPYLVKAGIACWAQGTRNAGNDIRLEHELALQDVAAGMNFLRSRGFDQLLCLGVSGGASLLSFYNQQAGLAPGSRLERTPAGRPTWLNDAVMPEVDAFMFVSPHPGQGKLLQNLIDPSVTDEGDPFSIDPALFPFAAENGYAPPPEGARYDGDFLGKYRAAQVARIGRIDGFARDCVAKRAEARRKVKKGTHTDLDAMVAAHQPIFNVWRTDADPRCFDIGLDPSDRRFGSLWGADPYASNFGAIGFGRVCTPESWLSTWSGLTSQAAFDLTGAAITQPVLMVEYTGDNSVFPSDLDGIFATIGSDKKSRVKVRGNHHGLPIVQGEPAGQEAACTAIIEWVEDVLGL